MKAKYLEIGMKVNSASRGEGLIIGKTVRTVTCKFPVSTVKWTYKKDCTVSELEINII